MEIVDILGTKYRIVLTTPKDDEALLECDGYCDDSIKTIVVSNEDPNSRNAKSDMHQVIRKMLRHEIIHAFLFESGLAENSEWAQNEEVVDWFAIQGPKIIKAWKDASALLF